MTYNKNETIANVKILTQEENEELIALIVKKAEQAVLSYTNREELVSDMSDVVEDVACCRYNLIGREGIEAESLGGNSISISQELPKSIRDRLNKYRINTARFL